MSTKTTELPGRPETGHHVLPVGPERRVRLPWEERHTMAPGSPAKGAEQLTCVGGRTPPAASARPGCRLVVPNRDADGPSRIPVPWPRRAGSRATEGAPREGSLLRSPRWREAPHATRVPVLQRPQTDAGPDRASAALGQCTVVILNWNAPELTLRAARAAPGRRPARRSPGAGGQRVGGRRGVRRLEARGCPMPSSSRASRTTSASRGPSTPAPRLPGRRRVPAAQQRRLRPPSRAASPPCSARSTTPGWVSWCRGCSTRT